MKITEIVSLIMSAITFIGIIFAIFLYFKNPQDKIKTENALNSERDKNKATILDQKEVDTKAQLLAQQMNSEKEDNNRRFKELGERLDASFLLASNHIHTVDTKVDTLTKEVGCLENSITKLGTIIEERIPRK